jgi:polysaccharide biosynthesis/export protein
MTNKKSIAIGLMLTVSALLTASAQEVPATSAAAQQDSAALYRLAAGDVITVRFFFNSELNDDIQIRPDGHISMQLIGDVVAGGKTVAELSRELEQSYAQEVKTPRVTIQVRSYGSQKVFVTGEVNRPGVISLIGGLDVLSAIGEAGGVRQSGKSSTVILIRKGPDGKAVARKLSLGSTSKPKADASLRLQPFDAIIVTPRLIAKLDRWVDEYIRQISPATLNAGFQYLVNRSNNSVSVVPF